MKKQRTMLLCILVGLLITCFKIEVLDLKVIRLGLLIATIFTFLHTLISDEPPTNPFK